MASTKRSRKRQRKPLGRRFWLVFWLLALTSVVVIGLTQSSLTQIAYVRVTAPESDDWDRLRGILSSLNEKPVLTISSYNVERLVESNPRVAHSTFSANLFGRARLAVAYRTPLALVDSDPGWGVDETGFIFPVAGRQAAVVRLRINVHDLTPNLTLADSSGLHELLQVVKKLQVELKKLGGIVAFDSNGRLCFNVVDGFEVVFGSPDRLEEKMAVLGTVLAADPELAKSDAIVNLVEPSAPMIKRLGE